MLQAMVMKGEDRRQLNWPDEKSVWRDGGGLLWIDLLAPTQADVEALGAEFGLHPFVVRACIHPEHRSRFKEYKDHDLLVLNALGRSTGEVKTGAESRGARGIGRWRALELNAVIGNGFLITVHHEPIAAVATLFQHWTRDGEGRPTLEYLLYSVVETVTQGFYAVLDRVDQQIDEVETQIFAGETRQQVVDRLFTLKRQVLQLRRMLGPQRDALGALMRREPVVLGADGHGYFLDIYEHTLRVFDLLDTYRDLISSSLDAYLSTVSNRMNEVMKTLTIVATSALPLTVITGVFGMNVPLPLRESPWGFPVVMGMMVLLSGGMAYYFRRRGWL